MQMECSSSLGEQNGVGGVEGVTLQFTRALDQ